MFAIAVATSSVNEVSRASVSAGSGSSRVDPARIAPHRLPSTRIGDPTAERMPISRMTAPSAPEELSAYPSTRTGRLVSNTSVLRL